MFQSKAQAFLIFVELTLIKKVYEIITFKDKGMA